MPMRSGLFLPLLDGLADPVSVTRLPVEAEEAGWHGVFVWDHVRWRRPVLAVADPWITLAAVAAAIERVQLGPMVTPLARRRPVKVARETVTLDRLSGGQLTLGAAWAPTSSGVSSRSPTKNSTSGGGHGCWMRRHTPHPLPHRSHGVTRTGADHKRLAAQFVAARAIPGIINSAAQMVLIRVLACGQAGIQLTATQSCC